MAQSRLVTAFDEALVEDAGAMRVLAIGIPGDMELAGLSRQELHVVQRNKPDFDRLSDRGFSPSVEVAVEDGTVDVALVSVPRSRQLAQIWIGQAARALRPEGLLMVDGARTDGIDSLYKACRKRMQPCENLAKAHGRLFWGRPSQGAFDDWAKLGLDWPGIEGFRTAPGVFSSDHVDAGSAALAAALPADLSGQVADFGAGWGYLSSQILKRPKVRHLDLIEADHAALEAARANITDPRAAFHWADATRWSPDGRLDHIVCNPPFHTGRKPDPSLGQAFLASAARGLSKGGTLWLVANRHLPYETTLGALFSDITELDGTPAFKVLRVRHPKR